MLPWSRGEKENWGTVQGGSNKGSSVLLRQEKETGRREGRGGTGGWVCCKQQCQVSRVVDQQAQCLIIWTGRK